MDYGPIVTFNLKTGKLEETHVDDAWVLENTREVQLIADKTTINADGEDAARVVVMLTSGTLVSVAEKRTIEESVTITLIADGARYDVPLVAGVGTVSVKAVAADSYQIAADGIAGEALTITAEDAAAFVGLADAPLEGETVIVLGKAKKGDKASIIGDALLETLTGVEFDAMNNRDQINLLRDIVVSLMHMEQGKRTG